MFSVYLRTLLNGTLIGEDEFGTKYYEEKKHFFKGFPKFGQPRKKRRWAVFKKEAEASQIPSHWHGWLHYTTDEIPETAHLHQTYTWQKEHQPNLTGTPKTYRPKGSLMSAHKIRKDYEAWTPPS